MEFVTKSLDSMIGVVFKCKICSVESDSVDGLREHVKQTHCCSESINSGDQSSSQSSKEKDFCGISIIVENSSDISTDEEDGGDFVTTTCNKTQNSKIEDNIHSSFVCPSCTKMYKTHQGLIKHSEVCLSKRCVVCNKRYKTEKELLLHQESHHDDNTFKCRLCDYISPQWTQVKIHMETHNNPETNKCDDCGMTFASLVAFKNHCRFQHLGGKHLCDICGFEATSKYTLFQHRIKCGNDAFRCSDCNFNCNNEVDFNNHILMRHGSGYICKYCTEQQSFATRTLLHSHMLEQHNGKKCYICDRCNYVAKLRHHLEKHYLMHTGERPLKCQIENCNFATRDRRNLKQHMVTKHSNPGDLVCRQCHFVTSSQNDWDVHIALHHMKIFNCKHCDYKANSSACLRRHRLAKHVEWNQIRYPCPKCSYRTNFRESLNKHLLTHALRNNRHRCSFCKNIFSDRTELKEHLNQKHRNKATKVLFCESCSYSCVKSHALRQHMLTHSDVKAHNCDLCDYSSRTNIALKAHKLRKHHGEKNVE